eukprot:1161401-Pelagomonas_calceolata.AAC.12
MSIGVAVEICWDVGGAAADQGAAKQQVQLVGAWLQLLGYWWCCICWRKVAAVPARRQAQQLRSSLLYNKGWPIPYNNLLLNGNGNYYNHAPRSSALSRRASFRRAQGPSSYWLASYLGGLDGVRCSSFISALLLCIVDSAFHDIVSCVKSLRPCSLMLTSLRLVANVSLDPACQPSGLRLLLVISRFRSQMKLDARPKAEKEVEGTVPSLNMTASLASNGKLNVDLSSKNVLIHLLKSRAPPSPACSCNPRRTSAAPPFQASALHVAATRKKTVLLDLSQGNLFAVDLFKVSDACDCVACCIHDRHQQKLYTACGMQEPLPSKMSNCRCPNNSTTATLRKTLSWSFPALQHS